MASLMLRTLGRQSSAARNTAVFRRACVPMATMDAYKDMDEFWKKNRRLNRPLSPHLSIYKPQLTSMLSLGHRVTGIAMTVTVSGVSILLLCLPGDFTSYMTMVQNLHLPAAAIIAAKYVVAFPVCYHYVNGIRHLAWDWSWGFGLDRLYKTGYFMLTMAILSASYFVFGM